MVGPPQSHGLSSVSDDNVTMEIPLEGCRLLALTMEGGITGPGGDRCNAPRGSERAEALWPFGFGRLHPGWAFWPTKL